jgi:adenylate cyclase
LLQFGTFRSQLLTLIIGLLSLVLGTVFLAVNRANETNARILLEDALEVTAGSFARSLQDREAILTEKVRLLSGDFAFKRAFATSEQSTILSALENHRIRAGAAVMMITSMQGEVIADTLHPERQGVPLGLDELMASAMADENGEATAIQRIGGRVYQVVMVPLFTPRPAAWLLIGFLINDEFTHRQGEFTHSEISLIQRRDDQGWSVISSTLTAGARIELEQGLRSVMLSGGSVFDVLLGGEDYLSLLMPIQSGATGQVDALLQRSLDQALAPFRRLRRGLLLLFGLGLLASVIGAVMMARGLSRPVEQLMASSRRIEAGDYSGRVDLKRRDELGQLGEAFNTMARGLAERDQVQNVLGKVVSPEIAAELLSDDIALGGEEREATILFSDIRSFTSLCEHRSPEEILTLLNRFLTAMSVCIEAEGGVVDKYIGDAIMALFGVPVSRKDHPQRAVRCGLAMIRALHGLNRELRAGDQGTLSIGVGINTGIVVAGNMGSVNRLNYTVIGDEVNLSSRLEGLTKYYGAAMIVSDSTQTRCEDMAFRELDIVRVKGKEEPVTIFEPIDGDNDRWDAAADATEQFGQVLSCYRALDLDGADRHLAELESRYPEDPLLALYRQRVEAFRAAPPSDWDGVTVFSTK